MQIKQNTLKLMVILINLLKIKNKKQSKQVILLFRHYSLTKMRSIFIFYCLILSKN